MSKFKVKEGLNVPTGTNANQGDIIVETTAGLQFYHNSANRTAVDTDSTQTLTGKTLSGNTATNLVSGSGTLTLPTSGTITVPNGTDTLVGKATTDTLTNKTLTAPVISTISNTGTITLPTATCTLMGKDTTDTMTNKTFDADGTGNSITNIENADIKAGAAIDATKIADGSVTNTEFQYISTLSSNAQTQLDAKAPSSSPTLITPTTDIVTLDGQGSTPANPSAGYYKAYVADSDGKLKILNSSGVVTTVGSGSGGINYLNVTTNNSDAEAGTGDWAAYADAAATSPVDGTGGSPTVTLTQSSSSPLRGTYSYLITKDAANRQGEGAAVAFTIDTADKSKQLAISFDYEASANYTGSSGTEYLTCYVYDVTNATLIATSNVNVPYGSGTQTITFNSTTSTSYRLIFHVAGTGTSAWTFKLDNVKVGPQEVISGAAISDWQSYTPTGSLSSNVTYTGFWRRIGDSMHCKGLITFTGVNTQGAVTLNLPSGYTIDTTKLLLTTSNDTNLGIATLVDSGTQRLPGRVQYNDSTSVAVIVYNDDTSTGSGYVGTVGVNTNTGVPITYASGDLIIFDYTIPIANWSSNIQLANSRVEYASNSGMGDAADSTSFVNDPNGSPMPAATYTAGRLKTVRFKNPIQAGDTIQIQVKPNNSQNVWIDIASGGSFVDGGSSVTISNSLQGTNDWGINFYSVVNSTDVQLYFGRYAFGTTNYSASNTSRWRVVKYSNAVPVEVKAPEYQEAVLTTETESGGADTYVDVTGASLTLTPGVWDIGFEGTIAQQYISGTASGNLAITDSSNNILGSAVRCIFDGQSSANSHYTIMGMTARNISVTASTTVKLRVRCIRAAAAGKIIVLGSANQSGSLTDPDHKSVFWARRIS